MSALDALVEAIAAAPALDRGLCVGQHDLWDETDDPAAVDQAIGLCHQCPVLAQCAEWVNSLSPRKRPIGVVAGAVREAK